MVSRRRRLLPKSPPYTGKRAKFSRLRVLNSLIYFVAHLPHRDQFPLVSAARGGAV